MSEKREPGITFEQIRERAKKPRELSSERWAAGLAVVQNLMRIGYPTKVIEDSSVGPNVPNEYYVTGTGVTVNHMPQWSYAIVEGKERTMVPLPPADTLSSKEVFPGQTAVSTLNAAIVASWR